MRMTQLLAPTLRENPADAEVVSHQLLVRAGYIRRLANGVYNYLPLMWRVLRKVEQIVREEMDRAGAQELLMPILQPAEVWQASGRWDVYGELMMRVKDRHGREYGLAPTAEEVITDIATKEVRSYRQLPVNLYQIQTKYRDEIRPRFGLLRGREFIMKDAYSFHSSQDCLDREYQKMAETYTRIFERCGLETRQVRSDSGAIGGSVSHEYMVLTRIAPGEQESGENDVFFCDSCDYAANAERAESILPEADTTGDHAESTVLDTPNASTIEALERKFQLRPETILKTLIYVIDEKMPVMALIRGDLAVEEIKLLNAFAGNEIRLATEEEIIALIGDVKGYVGPYNLSAETLQKLKIIADRSVSGLRNFVMAINERGKHLVGANWGDAHLHEPQIKDADLRLAKIGDACVECKTGKLNMTRGIEVGNIFQLGTKYSGSMNATYTDEDGSEKPFIMGCYGIGVSRTAAAAIERFHDKSGIIWPMAIAPYQAIVVPVNVTDDTQMSLAQRLYEQLRTAGVEVVMDDRDERAGVKFKDADLIGFPIRVTAGKKAAEGLLEVKLRDQDQAIDLPEAEVLPFVLKQIQEWRPALKSPQPAAV
ncbi:proline--tRNA ligase [Vampirovibrio chlorellavorus]|uniref:proline--tRNA ligase n=1 Tax=Vampirovibrio chlorellavorus TaxID=758823 RepID=UPI0026ED8016|nr:proline--tRNA ligase [Vampirovibrio chlorellavorus]